MKRIFLSLVLIVFSLSGCSLLNSLNRKTTYTTTNYFIKLDSVQSNKKGKVEEKAYSDDVINIVWEFSYEMTNIGLTLKNKSDKTMKVDWNSAAYVNPENQSMKVMHSGVKFVKKEENQQPSILVSESILSDSIIPIDKVYFNAEKSFLQDIGWKIEPMLSSTPQEELTGKTFKVLLPVILNDTKFDYVFVFKFFKEVKTEEGNLLF